MYIRQYLNRRTSPLPLWFWLIDETFQYSRPEFTTRIFQQSSLLKFTTRIHHEKNLDKRRKSFFIYTIEIDTSSFSHSIGPIDILVQPEFDLQMRIKWRQFTSGSTSTPSAFQSHHSFRTGCSINLDLPDNLVLSFRGTVRVFPSEMILSRMKGI